MDNYKGKTPSSVDPLSIVQAATEYYTSLPCGEIEYRKVAEDFHELSGAAYAVLNEVSENGDYTITRAISGLPSDIEKASKILGFRLLSASYKMDSPVTTLFETDKLTDLGTLGDVTGVQLPGALSRRVARMFGLEKVYGLGLQTKAGPLATVILMYKEGDVPENTEYIELLGRFVSICMERKNAQNDYLSRLFEQEQEKGGGIDKALLALRSASEKIPDIIYQLDENGDIVFINQAIQRYGYSREELIGRSILEIIHPDDRDKAKHRIRERRTGARRTLNFEVRLRTKSRTTSYFTFHTRSIPEAPIITISAEGLYQGEVEDQNYIGTIGVGHDITEKKLMEYEIAEQEQMFHYIAESVGEAIWLEEANPFKIVYENQACKELFHLSSEELEDPAAWVERVHPEDRDRFKRFVEATLKEGYEEYRIDNKEGEELWVRSKLFPLDSPEAFSRRYVGIAVDITAEKQEQEQLKEKVAAGEAFVREVNHRVKNNLAMIDSMLNLQLQRIMDTPSASAVSSEAEEKMKSLLLEVKSRLQAVGLVHEMLYHGYEQRQIDVSSYLSSLGDNILASSMQDPGKVTIEYQIPAVWMNIKTVIPLGMIFSELMTNVIKYAFPGDRTGTVRVLLESRDKEHTLTVADNGVGLPEDYVHRKEESIGHLLVSALSDQIDGEFSMMREEGETRCVVTFAPQF